MRTETDEIRENLKYLSLLARDFPSQAAAASEIISTQALLKLPKGTEHFMSDLHGENEAFVHILNSASGVIREKVDIVLGDAVPEATRAELATLIYYPNEKLPQLKGRCADEEALEQWYSETLLRLIDIQNSLLAESTLMSFTAGFKLAWGMAKELEADGLYSFEREEEEHICHPAEQED